MHINSATKPKLILSPYSYTHHKNLPFLTNLHKFIYFLSILFYITTNKSNKVLYTGITNDLKNRIYQHKQKVKSGFTKKYNVNKLVYYEVYQDAYNAIQREKQIKAGSRKKKIELINNLNNDWRDLYNEI
jgi:putative endonuclease